MKRIKVSLYVREHGTRRYKPVKRNTSYPVDTTSVDTTYVLRYGSTWETLNVDNLSDATAKRIERANWSSRGGMQAKARLPRLPESRR